jgi:hypothetical protein
VYTWRDNDAESGVLGGRYRSEGEPAFEDIFAFAEGTGKIAVLIGEYRRGKQIEFPVDLGEIVDFRPTFALGGPEAEDEGPAGDES